MDRPGKKLRPAAAADAAALEADQIREYLRQNPEFLSDNLDFLAELAPDDEAGGGVVDLRDFLVRRLRKEVGALKASRDGFVRAARARRQALNCVHGAVLALLAARDFQHFVHVVTADLAEHLALDVVSLAVESVGANEAGEAGPDGVMVLAPGAVARLLGVGETMAMSNQGPAPAEIYGPAAALARSRALVRLAISPRVPPGLLALGSRDPRRFESGDTSALLLFLAGAIESQFRAWLDLPR